MYLDFCAPIRIDLNVESKAKEHKSRLHVSLVASSSAVRIPMWQIFALVEAHFGMVQPRKNARLFLGPQRQVVGASAVCYGRQPRPKTLVPHATLSRDAGDAVVHQPVLDL